MKSKPILSAVIFLLFINFPLLFANYDYVTDIQVTGNINVSSSLIKSTSRLAEGDIFSTDEVAQAIKSLYKLHLFANIKINKMRTKTGIKLIINIQEFPIIKKVSISGNEKIKKDKILDAIDIAKGEYWSPKKEFISRNKILDLYKEQGYRLASVEFQKTVFQKHRIDLVITINEGHKVKIDEIKFTGNEQILSKKLKGEMKTHTKGWFHSGKFNPEEFKEDLVRITEYYKSKGFINAEVQDWDKQFDDKGNLILIINVYEGKQYKITSVIFTGNTRFSNKVLEKELKIEPGEILNQEKFIEKMNNIRMKYYEDGYIYSMINQELKTEGDSLQIILKINENTRARVRKIIITGNQKTRESVIRRNIVITPGDYFRQSLVQRSQRNIYNLGFFTPNLGLDYKQINDEGDIDLILTLEDKISGNANFGVNYDQQDKLVGFISVSHNNLFGKAMRLQLKWEFSGIKQNYDISFTNPYLFGRNMLVGFDVYHTEREWTDWNYIVKRTGGGLRYGTGIPIINRARFTTGYSISRKEYQIINESDDIIDELQYLVDEGKQTTSNMFVTLERDDRNNIFRPSEGALIRLYSELAGGFLGGNVNYFKEIIQTNWYVPLFWKFALGVKWRLGYITEFGSTKEVPLDEKFYPGGIGPDGIRGYDDRSITPTGVEGANAELITSSEITFPISGDQIVGVGFFDAGNSYNYFSEIDIQDLKKGAGVGVRIRTPMGLMGFDYAYGFDRETDNKWKFHFQFGTTF